MDGVIVDSESRHERAYLDVVRDLGYGDNHGLEFADYVGRSDDTLWKDFIARHNPPQPFEELLALKTRRVVELIRHERPLFEALPGLVRKLAGRYTLALASGSERPVVEEVLRLDGLGQFFAAVVTGSDIKNGKPAPDIFLRAAALLNIAPHECWVIEDSKTGVTAGIAAGMRVIAITNTYRADELAHATHVVGTYRQIEELLLTPD
jgi:HAD superfamily hydrolase (TIGR01509 family)